MKKILHLTLFLAIVSVIAGGALAYFNELTEPVIAENEAKQERETLLEMYPDANVEDFKNVDLSSIESKTINKIYSYQDFYIFNMSVSGYSQGTTFLVSIDKNNLNIDKFIAISNGDTSGLGTQVLDELFRKSMEGNPADGQLDTISGATISSSAVVNGIHEAASVVESLE